MGLAERRAQTVRITGHEDQVDLAVHQAPRKAACLACVGRCGDKLEIFAPVVAGEEHRQPHLAALGAVGRDL